MAQGSMPSPLGWMPVRNHCEDSTWPNHRNLLRVKVYGNMGMLLGLCIDHDDGKQHKTLLGSSCPSYLFLSLSCSCETFLSPVHPCRRSSCFEHPCAPFRCEPQLAFSTLDIDGCMTPTCRMSCLQRPSGCVLRKTHERVRNVQAAHG